MKPLRLFAAHRYRMLTIRHDSELAHYSGLTPRFWRFPFMDDRDLQIGDTWTAPRYRGQGIALRALRIILKTEYQPGRRFWYIVDAHNSQSIRVAEKAGFEPIADGTTITPLNIPMLWRYAILSHRRTSAAVSA
ncbi:MAG: GNAT family N-acetyltransferase [Candidatus Binataceae bacterium]|nr:GNAT family N-acetyltransferase [Candidatus Binataceae bacterium]